MSLVTMREILPYAEEKKIAIPAFNIATMEITQAILETVEEENCPAIIAVGQAAIKDGKLESLAATVRTLAKDMRGAGRQRPVRRFYLRDDRRI